MNIALAPVSTYQPQNRLRVSEVFGASAVNDRFFSVTALDTTDTDSAAVEGAEEFAMSIGTTPSERALNLAKEGKYEASLKVLTQIARSVSSNDAVSLKELSDLADDILDVVASREHETSDSFRALTQTAINVITDTPAVVEAIVEQEKKPQDILRRQFVDATYQPEGYVAKPLLALG